MKQNARGLRAVVHNVAAAPAVINGSCASFAARIPKGRACAPVLFERRRVCRNPSPLVRGLPLAPAKCEGTERRAAHPFQSTPCGAGTLWLRVRAVRRSIAASIRRRAALSDVPFRPAYGPETPAPFGWLRLSSLGQA